MNAILQSRSAEWWSGFDACRQFIYDRHAHERQLVATLTARQRDVIAGSMRGLTLEQIGAALGISWRTVEQHRQAAVKKLGVGSAFEAVVIATRAGLGE